MESRKPKVQGQLQLQIMFEAKLGFIKTCLKNKQTKSGIVHSNQVYKIQSDSYKTVLIIEEPHQQSRFKASQSNHRLFHLVIRV